jgi:hypothetical protein
VISRPADDLEAAIIGYLFEHPNAMDTVNGIRQWWLERPQARVGIDELSRTLAGLVDRGVLEMIVGQHAPLYRLRKRTRQTRH